MATWTTADLKTLLGHDAWLRALARCLVHSDDPDDLVQETWVATLEAPPSVATSPRGWFAQVLRNFARKRARGRARREAREVAAPVLPEPAPMADEALQRLEAQRIVAELITGLDEPFRSTVLLRFYDGISAADIARRFGVPAGTVRWRLKEGLDRLRARLDERYRGERRAWVVVLAPFAGGSGPPPTPGPRSIAPVSAPIVGATVAALLVGGLWWGTRPPRSSQGRFMANEVRRSEGAPDRAWAQLLDPAPTNRTINGRVTAPDGSGVGDAIVTATPAPASRPDAIPIRRPLAWARSEADGTFQFAGLPAERLVLVAAHPSYQPAVAQVDPKQDSAAIPNLRLEPAAARLSGTVEDAGGGPLPGAVVLVRLGGGFAQAFVGRDGRYGLGVSLGRASISADARGYALASASRDLRHDEVYPFRLIPSGRLSGKVVVRPSHDAAAGAVVRLGPEGSEGTIPVAIADEHGEFVVEDVDTGTYRLSAAMGAFLGRLEAPVSVSSGAPRENLVIAVERAARIAGRVLAPDRRPAAGAKIRLRATGGVLGARGRHVATSDQAGSFEVLGVERGRFVLSVTAPPHAPAELEVLVGERDLDGLEVTLPTGARITGIALSHAGAVVPAASIGVVVVAEDETTATPLFNDAVSTDPKGRFQVEGLPPGFVVVRAEHPSHGRITLPRFKLEPGGDRETAVRFAAPAFVEGVATWDDNRPAAGVRVSWSGVGGGSAVTNASGAFRIGPLAAGFGLVRAEPLETGAEPDFNAPSSLPPLPLSPGETKRDVRVVVPRFDRHVAGVVVDADGRPIEGVRVGIVPSLGAPPSGAPLRSRLAPVLTGADGRFRLAPLPRGRYVVFASHPEHPPGEVRDVADGAADVRVALPRGASVDGRVVDEAGHPVRAYALVAVPPVALSGQGSLGDVTQWNRRRVNAADGGFRLAGLAPGRWDLLVSTERGEVGAIAALSLTPGERRSDVRIQAGPAASIEGRILLGDTAAPLPGARVSVIGRSEPYEVSTDAEGKFSVPGLVPGRTVVLQFRKPGMHADQRQIQVPATQGARISAPPLRIFPASVMPAQGADTAVPGLVLDASRAQSVALVRSVVPGSPAARAGVQVGDRVMALAGTPTVELGAETRALLLAGPRGSRVDVVLEGASGQKRTVTLERTVPYRGPQRLPDQPRPP